MSETSCIQAFEVRVLQLIKDEVRKSQEEFLESYRHLLVNNPQFSFVVDPLLKLATQAQGTPQSVLQKLQITSYHTSKKELPRRYKTIRGKTSHICRDATLAQVIQRDIDHGGSLHKKKDGIGVTPLKALADELADEYNTEPSEKSCKVESSRDLSETCKTNQIHVVDTLDEPCIQLSIQEITTVKIKEDRKLVPIPDIQDLQDIHTYCYDSKSGLVFVQEPTGDCMAVGQATDGLVRWFSE